MTISESNDAASRSNQSWPDDGRDSSSGSFVAHLSVARLMSDILPADASIIEFGCAAGLMGEQLAQHGFKEITGVEQSSELRAAADRKNCYRSIRSHDLTQPLRDDVRYSAGVCVGNCGNSPVTAAHIGYMMAALVEDAPLFLTVNGEAWHSENWPEELEAAQLADGFTIEYVNTIAYLDKSRLDGRLILIRNTDTGKET